MFTKSSLLWKKDPKIPKKTFLICMISFSNPTTCDISWSMDIVEDIFGHQVSQCKCLQQQSLGGEIMLKGKHCWKQ